MTVDEVLEQIRQNLKLEAETEHELLEEVRGHLEDKLAAARAQGLDETTALTHAAREFGIEDTAR